MRSARVGEPPDGAALIAGRYRVERILGVGGTARVLRVIDEATGSPLALKLLEEVAVARASALFEQEYQTLASLSHPRIVRVFDYGLDHTRGFYTMELLEGDDLKVHAPVPWREACAYLRDAAEALGVIHARQLVHRDVSLRNLWRTPDGRVKLIDFGALTSFGPTTHLVGTPPNLPPEALSTRVLDQRADLYALGAVAYYLLTGTQAYPARDVRDLPALWEQGFELASRRVAKLARDDLPPVPPALDRLIVALLQPEPIARPGSAEELIDRLDALLGDTVPDDSAPLRLGNSAFVGRARELRHLRRMLMLAHAGRGQVALVEGEAAMGGSRLLRELGLEAQVAPATVLAVDASACSGLYGVASALAQKLLTALPTPAHAAAAQRAEVLAHASPALAESLGAQPGAQRSELTGGALELRVRVQAALRDWFLEVARAHPLVVLVDGLEQVDDGSAAFLHALAGGVRGTRLLLCCSLRREQGRKARLGERAFAQGARRVILSPLSEQDVFALLRSVFGDVAHLGRLANRLQQAARGNPGYILELAEQLTRRGVIRASASGWVLPRELPAEALASSHEQALIAALELLSPPAAELAEVLSVATGVIEEGLAQQLAEQVSPRLFAALAELVQADVIARTGTRLHFVHPQVRMIFRARLRPERHREVARALGAHLLGQKDGDPLVRLAAGLHLIEGGDPQGAQIVAETSVRLALYEHDRLRLAPPLIESALTLLRVEGHDEQALVALTASLAIAGYYVDLRYAERYGDAALATLSELLALPLARKLRRRLGRRLSVIGALTIAALRLRRRAPTVPAFRQSLLLLSHCAATLTAASVLLIDPDGAQRRADALEPLTAIRRDGAAAFVYEFCCTLVAGARDTPGQSCARLARVLARLEGERAVRGLPAPIRRRYLGGALHMRGVMEGMRDGGEALRTADRLAAMGLFHELNAEQVRMMYYGNQGARAQLEQATQRVEQHAIQHGVAAMVETWTLSMQLGVALRTHDIVAMKRAWQELAHLSRSLPLFEPVAQRARGLYLMLHGRYTEALPVLERCLDEPVRGRSGWGRMHAALAHTYNVLGEHARAQAACERVISVMDEADHDFTALFIPVLTEWAVARAGQGDVSGARAHIASLLARHAPGRGPLTLGQIHEAALTIALLARDRMAAREHLEALEGWYLSTDVPSLIQHCKALRQRVEAADSRPAPALAADSSDASALARALSQCTAVAPCAERALAYLLAQTGASVGYLYVLEPAAQPQLAAAVGPEPPAMLLPWLQRTLERDVRQDVTMGLSVRVDTVELETDVRIHEALEYRLLLLSAPGEGAVGACVIAAPSLATAVPASALAAIAHALTTSRAAERASASLRRPPA